MELAKWSIVLLMLFLASAVALLGVIALVVEVHLRRRATMMSTEELERIVYGDRQTPRGFDWYLDYVGRERLSVRTFVSLIEARDATELYRRWPSLEKDFLRAERANGRQGRPLIMDAMFHYRGYVRELIRRRN